MDIESSSSPAPLVPAPIVPKPRRCRPACCCCAAVVGLIVIILVVLALTLFKAKDPTTTIDSVALRSIDFSLLTLKLNLTLALGITVDNPNRVGFQYRDSVALLHFGDTSIGQAPIQAGRIGSRSSEALNITLTVFVDRLLANNQADLDVLAGSLPLNVYTRISGKVRLLHFIKFHVVSTASCDVVVFVYNGTVGNELCTYKTKL